MCAKHITQAAKETAVTIHYPFTRGILISEYKAEIQISNSNVAGTHDARFFPEGFPPSTTKRRIMDIKLLATTAVRV